MDPPKITLPSSIPASGSTAGIAVAITAGTSGTCAHGGTGKDADGGGLNMSGRGGGPPRGVSMFGCSMM
ncbi:hypothetical protein Dda_2117 [Drechslerella dactyloides]|uniref:Uncharacterized protein n=1 Tax=Drechslerella dactyloides TaxID=74499 RepID=A0AAD6J338_DREDA|nr:hypothetical protein Dda_2117 [Drechslerella dactyloides]